MRDDEASGIIYRTHDNSAPTLMPAADSEADPWEPWHRWCDSRADSRIELALDRFTDDVVEAIVDEGDELLDVVREGFKKRDREIAELKGRIDMLTSLLTKGAAGADIIPLPGRKHG